MRISSADEVAGNKGMKRKHSIVKFVIVKESGVIKRYNLSEVDKKKEVEVVGKQWNSIDFAETIIPEIKRKCVIRTISFSRRNELASFPAFTVSLCIPEEY